MASLVKGQRVRLEIQTVPSSRDRYGRLLAFVFRQSDNLLVNKEITRQGYGHVYTKYPFDPARRNSVSVHHYCGGRGHCPSLRHRL